MRRLIATMAFLMLIVVPLPSLAEKPSTQKQRDRAVEIAKQLEAAPWGPKADKIRAEVLEWWITVPDVNLTWCASLLQDFEPEDEEYGRAIILQATISAGAFVIEHPDQANNPRAVSFAGVEGAIRAYRSLIATDEARRHPFMDRIVELADADRLGEYIEPHLKDCE
jgi:hypothetical protein